MSNAEDGYLGDWLPHKETCRCIDCELERATTQIRTLRAQFAAAQAELSRVREWWSVAYDGEVQAGEKLFAAFNKMRNELCDAQAKLDEALCANELDRRSLHAVVSSLEAEITGRMWLIEGRGCYEWDDDKYQQEFGWAIHAIQEKLEPLRKIASDLTNSPTRESGVERVRRLEAAQERSSGALSWAKTSIPGRGDIIGFRLDEEGNIEYLCHNEALCNPYYLAKERRHEVR